MKSFVQFDELNIALLEALRLNVRAPWEVIGKAIGVDGVTARRRWNRIVEQRHAWTTVSTGNWPGQVTVLLTARCVAGTALDVARALAPIPAVVTIETLVGQHDVRCTVVLQDMAALSRFLSTEISGIPGLLSVQTQLVDTVYVQGSNFRAGALTANAERSLNVKSADSRSYSRQFHEIDAPMIEHLIHDARTPAKTLADRLGVSETLVRRRINSLVSSGALVLRAEAAPHLVGLPYAANVWFAFDAQDLHAAASTVSTFPEARWTVSIVAGPANLFCSFWFRDFAQLQNIESIVQEKFPSARVVDRSVKLKPVKRMMHVLDDDGLTTDVIAWMPHRSADG
ncbi:Lrp/AsnC family transcriptional regulator [Herbiconiux sp. UC225_62]|uniref:Lrp/AsnC family transcriptional regulator n=1 Tax=Herbiconiux sp. UC225_62 TaxID=3350168 RepID=UPI0036D2E5D3